MDEQIVGLLSAWSEVVVPAVTFYPIAVERFRGSLNLEEIKAANGLQAILTMYAKDRNHFKGTRYERHLKTVLDHIRPEEPAEGLKEDEYMKWGFQATANWLQAVVSNRKPAQPARTSETAIAFDVV